MAKAIGERERERTNESAFHKQTCEAKKKKEREEREREYRRIQFTDQ
jgi:hypothetical protein